MTAVQVVLLAIVQGVTELFPISSLGHAVLMPALLGWRIDEHAAGFLPFLVVIHLGTAAALLAYFARDWLDFGTAVLVSRTSETEHQRRLLWMVCVATVPAMVVGLAFEHLLRSGFGAPRLAATFLALNGVMLFVADRWKTRHSRDLSQLRWRDALAIGCWQCLALIPGFSRSGATMSGGYLAGLSHEDAARFSFLTATPIILGAGILEVPKLIHQSATFNGIAILAGSVAGVVAYASLAALMRFFGTHEVRAFQPFAVYCLMAGIGSFVILAMG